MTTKKLKFNVGQFAYWRGVPVQVIEVPPDDYWYRNPKWEIFGYMVEVIEDHGGYKKGEGPIRLFEYELTVRKPMLVASDAATEVPK